MHRVLSATLELDLGGSIDLIFQVAAAQHAPFSSETLSFTQNDRTYAATEIIDQVGSRLHRVRADAGPLLVTYDAVVQGRVASLDTAEAELITYLRPSRYSQSDEVFSQARRQFRGLHGHDLLTAVGEFVHASTTYTPGLSRGTDSAMTTLTTGQGVCRDYAHLVVALLRAMDVPARYAACYAPGLVPMDFHAVAEAYLDGQWHAIDATRLAHRAGLVRIATGRDAADCAFLSYYGGNVTLNTLRVNAQIDEDHLALADPASDDHSALVQIG